ncbi:hypothetical protein CL1_0323 [Thermococcus cleftensis]|uniref:Uncharacterized protein n=1 Tax=Thermococcus cleftensis (strain DSM 27260 / KACC 17922 / CL1) TaxID=163003 RepID=I3ZS50_THECF|nr:MULTISPECIES: hypothetical protein [Thermococcus]AFL94534.1 hypothetical protein CL1_0323 [Thermococcus cleftensis]NJE04236.1 hypothetical protein [Thermococcus sp. MV11]
MGLTCRDRFQIYKVGVALAVTLSATLGYLFFFSHSVITSIELTTPYLLILGLYSLDAVRFIIRNCILGYQVSKKELEEIIISTQQRLELKYLSAPILFYAWLAFVMYILSRNPLAILLVPLWTVDLYITMRTALSCAKECLMTIENNIR